MEKITMAVLLLALASVHQTQAAPLDSLELWRADDGSLRYGYDSPEVFGFDDLFDLDFDSAEHYRVRRQAAAADLSLNHEKDGRPRPVGKPHGFVSANGSGNNRDNHHVNLGAGVGTVAWRSRNNRHSVGVGATVDQYRGRFNGQGYRSKPNVGVGVGYKFRF